MLVRTMQRANRIVSVLRHALAIALLAISGVPRAGAQCPPQAQIQNFTGAGRVTCPCFVSGEQAGAVLTAPPADYPLEILRVGIGWGSTFGGTPPSLEEAIHVYEGGLPDPGAPIFTLEGPVLNDGAINQFDLEPIPGEIVIDSGPFAVTLEFLNDNAGNFFAPSVVHDGNGCQPGRNAIYAVPGGWSDACGLGISGDWQIFVIYRPCVQTLGVGDRIVSSAPAILMAPRPNPSPGPTELEFVLAQPGSATLAIHDLTGRRIAVLAEGAQEAGVHRLRWDGRASDGARAPSGVYFAELRTDHHRARRTLLIAR
jgi:hypothetical protein